MFLVTPSRSTSRSTFASAFVFLALTFVAASDARCGDVFWATPSGLASKGHAYLVPVAGSDEKDDGTKRLRCTASLPRAYRDLEESSKALDSLLVLLVEADVVKDVVNGDQIEYRAANIHVRMACVLKRDELPLLSRAVETPGRPKSTRE